MPPSRSQLEASLRSLNNKLLERLRTAEANATAAQSALHTATCLHTASESARKECEVARRVAEDQLTESITSCAHLEARLATSETDLQASRNEVESLRKRVATTEHEVEMVRVQLADQVVANGEAEARLKRLEEEGLSRPQSDRANSSDVACSPTLPASSSSIETTDSAAACAPVGEDIVATRVRATNPSMDTRTMGNEIAATRRHAHSRSCLDVVVGAVKDVCFACRKQIGSWFGGQPRSHVRDEELALVPQ